MERATFRLPELGFAIPVADFAAWLDAAPAQDALLYAHGLVPPRKSATWLAAREAADVGLITLTSRKVHDVASGGRIWHFLAVRCGGARHDVHERDGDLDPDAERILKIFRRKAAFDQVAPTNGELAEELSLSGRRARYMVEKLITARMISIVDHGPRKRRVVSIRAEGTGCGKSTRAGAL